MQVIFGNKQKEMVSDRLTVLELDTFIEPGMQEPITAYAVIGADDIKLQDVVGLSGLKNVHNSMMAEYRKKNWQFCHQALEHLKGKWNGVLDSFYDIFQDRIIKLEQQKLSADWDGVIHK